MLSAGGLQTLVPALAANVAPRRPMQTFVLLARPFGRLPGAVRVRLVRLAQRSL